MVTTEGMNDLAFFCRNPPASWRLIYLDETASTNSIGMELGVQGALAPTIVVANQQTAGRGRLGKTWQSYTGCGLYVSIVLRPRLALQHLSRITLAAGVALAETVARFTNVTPMLKWPNDLLLNGHKCGGILTESDVRNSQAPLVVIGIGVNVNSPLGGYGSHLRVKAGALNDCVDTDCTRAELLEYLIPAVLEAVRTLEEGRFQDILCRWRQYDYTKGKELTWLTAGDEVVVGVCDGISDEGLLFITDASGERHEVLSGDVQLSRS